jgi:transcriptional regulator with XRE-family HTH domain
MNGFAKYLKKNEISYTDFAASIGTGIATVRRYALGIRIPRPEIMERIRAATGGQVTPNDFYRQGD